MGVWQIFKLGHVSQSDWSIWSREPISLVMQVQTWSCRIKLGHVSFPLRDFSIVSVIKGLYATPSNFWVRVVKCPSIFGCRFSFSLLQCKTAVSELDRGAPPHMHGFFWSFLLQACYGVPTELPGSWMTR